MRWSPSRNCSNPFDSNQTIRLRSNPEQSSRYRQCAVKYLCTDSRPLSEVLHNTCNSRNSLQCAPFSDLYLQLQINSFCLKRESNYSVAEQIYRPFKSSYVFLRDERDLSIVLRRELHWSLSLYLNFLVGAENHLQGEIFVWFKRLRLVTLNLVACSGVLVLWANMQRVLLDICNT